MEDLVVGEQLVKTEYQIAVLHPIYFANVCKTIPGNNRSGI